MSSTREWEIMNNARCDSMLGESGGEIVGKEREREGVEERSWEKRGRGREGGGMG